MQKHTEHTHAVCQESNVIYTARSKLQCCKSLMFANAPSGPLNWADIIFLIIKQRFQREQLPYRYDWWNKDPKGDLGRKANEKLCKANAASKFTFFIRATWSRNELKQKALICFAWQQISSYVLKLRLYFVCIIILSPLQNSLDKYENILCEGNGRGEGRILS